MEWIDESILTGYPNMISYECTKNIIEQMGKKICKIKIGQNQGTGFFCKIPFPDKDHMLPVFITNNHVINEKTLNKDDKIIAISIREETEIKEIKLNNRIKYTNKQFDTTIIELKEKDGIKNYLELDDIILEDILNNKNNNKEYEDKTIYIIQYPKGKLSVSYGTLRTKFSINNYNFNHFCSTERGASGSPVLNTNNKLMGIHHKGGNNDINKNKGTFLNYPIKEFIQKNFKENLFVINNNINEVENENLIKEMNLKYKLNIQDIKITKLDKKYHPLGNEILLDLSKIEFKHLKEICLQYDDISDLKPLENAKFEKLEKLNLRANNISDINILEKVNFPELKDLSFYYNKISDIKVLENVKLEKLEYLNLGENKLSDISILEKVNFKELKTLYLDNNKITNIKVLAKVKFEKLELLNISGTEITNIDILEKVNFKELKQLYLYKIKISNIDVLERVNFEKLEILNLNENPKLDLSVLEKVKFKELKELYLENNDISDINFLEKLNFEKLQKLDISGNKISDINILEKVNFKELKELYLKNNNISDINILEKVNFEKLELLDLRQNKLSDINIFYKTNFNGLKKLYLSDNEIYNIKVLEIFSLEELKIENNKISVIKSFVTIGKLKYYGTKFNM